MNLERPDWFKRTAAWWNPVVGDDVARHVQPIGVSSDHRLYVVCSNMPWATNMRLLGPNITQRLNAQPPPGAPKVEGIAVVKPLPPEELIERWADLVGADLAEQLRPRSLADWGRELVTEAESAHARDLLARRAPVVLARMRAVLPETFIVRLGKSHLRTVWVVIASSPDFSDRQALENVLMDVWHDTAQTVGPEHPLYFLHAGETAADQMVEEWAAAVRPAAPSAPHHVDTMTYGATVDNTDPDALRRRDEWLAGKPHDLCVVFAARDDEKLPLAELARERGTTIWRHVQ
ncbi:DciA family protein [Streptomyces sennicomposti]